MPVDVTYIRQRRMQLGLTQQQAADAAGFPNLQKWSQYENGRIPDPQLSSLEAIAKALRCKVRRLLKPLPATAVYVDKAGNHCPLMPKDVQLISARKNGKRGGRPRKDAK